MATPKRLMHVYTLQPYGKDTVVQKRMRIRLRKLKCKMQYTKLSNGKTIGGKGRLTEEFIKKVPIYYGNTVHINKNDFFSLRKITWVVWMHYVSTDKDPQHFFYTKDENTWCKYNQAVHKNNLKTFQREGFVAKRGMI